jgi:uncharacterized protein DUF763
VRTLLPTAKGVRLLGVTASSFDQVPISAAGGLPLFDTASAIMPQRRASRRRVCTNGSRAGSADLPLHGGRVPKWLGDRMTRLGAVIIQAIVLKYGRDELLRRLAQPFWFQSFGAVMGMDWHPSGVTTSVIGALKRGLTPLSAELGIHVCGGRGSHSRQTPHELVAIGDRIGLDGAALDACTATWRPRSPRSCMGALSLQRPGAALGGPRRQGPASLPSAAQGLRSYYQRVEDRSAKHCQSGSWRQ